MMQHDVIDSAGESQGSYQHGRMTDRSPDQLLGFIVDLKEASLYGICPPTLMASLTISI